MKLLAIETATEACSAALYLDGDVRERFQLAPREHSRLLLPMLDELLAETDITLKMLDALAFGRGPGSFTGVRIAASIIQGIALGRDLPVVSVSSLAALAQGMFRAHRESQVLAAIDARMDEVYWGAYRADADGTMRLVGEERVLAAQDVPLPEGEGWTGAGTGWQTYGAELSERLGRQVSQWHGERYPSAADVAVLGAAGFDEGQAVSAEQALPVYLRDKVVG